MAALRAAKQALRREIKGRVAAVSDQEKLRQSRVVSQKVNVIDMPAELELVIYLGQCTYIYICAGTWPYNNIHHENIILLSQGKETAF